MKTLLLTMLINLNITAGPVQSVKQAEKRYGQLDTNFKPKQYDKWIVPFNFAPFGLKYAGFVNRDLVIPLTLVFIELQLSELVHEITDFKGCYNPRPISGTDRPSTHAYGLGCDFNHTKFSDRFVEIWTRYGFCWGGNFTTWKDYMHFSYGWECSYDYHKHK